MHNTRIAANNIHLFTILDYKNVIPIMVSADFLQMKILFQDCIQYCKTNLNEIIKTSSNLVCLGDNILKKYDFIQRLVLLTLELVVHIMSRRMVHK